MSFVPNKSGYGVEIRYGRDIKKRNNLVFISSGQWAEMGADGLIDQEVAPLVIGELIDPLDYEPYNEQNGILTPAEILNSDVLSISTTIDYQEDANKDGRITVFFPSARSYVAQEEIPFQSRGFKAENETVLGYSTGIIFDPFFDGGGSSLGITKEGYYGSEAQVKMTFIDRDLTDGLGFVIDNDDFDSDYQTGAFGTPLYSSEFGTDSIAYAGMTK